MMVLAVGDPCGRVDERHRLIIVLERIGFADYIACQRPPAELLEHVTHLRVVKRRHAAFAGFAGFVCQITDGCRHCILHSDGYSSLMRASRTTLVHLTDSWRKCSPNCSGVLPMMRTPSSTRRSRVSGCCSAFKNSVFRRAVSGAGRPAGVTMPYHRLASNPGTPDSAMVGS